MRTLSAIRFHVEDYAGARSDLILAATLDPFDFEDSFLPDRPTVLQIRCPEVFFLDAVKDRTTGLIKRLRRYGHFSVREFLARDKFNVIHYNLLSGVRPPFEALPRVDIILNTASDADACATVLPWMTEVLHRFEGIPVVNAPDRVLETTRDKNDLRLGQVPGVRFPRTRKLRYQNDPESFLASLSDSGFTFPVILRVPGTQTGVTAKKLENKSEAIAYLESKPGADEFYAIEYIDCGDRLGRYTKSRCFFIDGKFFPIAALTSDEWQIHSCDRYQVMDKQEEPRERERLYLENPEKFLGSQVFSALHRVRDVIDLDFFGIDFTVVDGNQLVIFEANAAMRHNFDHAENFPYTRPYLEAATRAFDDMIRRMAVSR